jgi:outer membrane protein OmpA-like peptidoglycan-associated protein
MSVVNYLITKGISQDRLKYRGYGNTSPIGDNVTAEGRRLNRRTEARVVGIKK